jgi:hypothetical protein
LEQQYFGFAAQRQVMQPFDRGIKMKTLIEKNNLILIEAASLSSKPLARI